MRKVAALVLKTYAIVSVSLLACAALVLTASGFSVSLNLPENQNPQTFSSFDLRVAPGQRQEISVSVHNPGEEDIVVEVSLFAVGTNRNGAIDYTSPGRIDQSAPHAFSDIATLPTDAYIRVPAGHVAAIPILLEIPPEGFEGTILGTVHLLLGITEEERAQAGMLVNRFAHAVAVRLQERDAAIEPDFALGEVSAQTVNLLPAIVAEIRNPVPCFALGAAASARIYPAGQSEPLFTADTYVDFAPSSVFEFTLLSMDGVSIADGEYLARVVVEHQGQAWEFYREFSVAAPEDLQAPAATHVQQQAPYNPSGASPTPQVWVIIAAALALCALVAALAIWLKRRAGG